MKKEIKLEMAEVLLKETKEIYNRNHENMHKIDSKLIQLFGFITALLLLFVNIIKFPSELWLRVIYVVTIVILLAALGIIIRAYKPMNYLAINPNVAINKYAEEKYKNKLELIEALAGTTGENVLSLKRNVNQKTEIIDWGAILIIIALILTIILKIYQGI